MKARPWWIGLLALSSTPIALTAQGLEGDELRVALQDEAASFWIYDDLDEATRQAEESGKPLLISFRCVP